jgi:hypothetical protein
MEYILLIAVLVGVAYFVFKAFKPATLDINKDGKVDLADVQAAAVKVEEVVVKAEAAVVAEVKVVAEEVKVAVKKTATRVKAKAEAAGDAVTTAVKKPRAKKTVE